MHINFVIAELNSMSMDINDKDEGEDSQSKRLELFADYLLGTHTNLHVGIQLNNHPQAPDVLMGQVTTVTKDGTLSPELD